MCNCNSSSPGPGTSSGSAPAPPAPVITIRGSVTESEHFPNPLNDSTIATTLTQVFSAARSTKAEFDKERDYTIYAPTKLVTDFFNLPPGSKPKARIALFFGVGPEMTLFRLRDFFANETNSVLIVVPGVEGGWPGITTGFGYGISTEIIKKLLEKATLTGIDFTVEVLAGYSTGYRGVNLTLINKLVDLSKLSRLIYLDAWYHHDDHPLVASGPYKARNTFLQLIQHLQQVQHQK